MMIVSELLEELTKCPPNAKLLVVEGNNMTTIASVNEGKSETTVLLIGEAIDIPGRGRASQLLAEAMMHGEFGKIFNSQICDSPNPGKFMVSIDGDKMMGGEFDTQQEARAFVRGFVTGSTVGGGLKNMKEGRPGLI
jgi:hypothetical protein